MRATVGDLFQQFLAAPHDASATLDAAARHEAPGPMALQCYCALKHAAAAGADDLAAFLSLVPVLSDRLAQDTAARDQEPHRWLLHAEHEAQAVGQLLRLREHATALADASKRAAETIFGTATTPKHKVAVLRDICRSTPTVQTVTNACCRLFDPPTTASAEALARIAQTALPVLDAHEQVLLAWLLSHQVAVHRQCDAFLCALGSCATRRGAGEENWRLPRAALMLLCALALCCCCSCAAEPPFSPPSPLPGSFLEALVGVLGVPPMFAELLAEFDWRPSDAPSTQHAL